MQKIVILLLFVFLSGCNSILRVRSEKQISPSGEVVAQHGFRVPEYFDKFRFDIVRRINSYSGTDMIYFRIDHTGPERLMVTSLLISVDGIVYQVPPSKVMRSEGLTEDKRDNRRYHLRQIEFFALTDNLVNLMRSAEDSIVVTVTGENRHFGANVYETNIKIKMQDRLDRLVEYFKA